MLTFRCIPTISQIYKTDYRLSRLIVLCVLTFRVLGRISFPPRSWANVSGNFSVSTNRADVQKVESWIFIFESVISWCSQPVQPKLTRMDSDEVLLILD